MNKYRTLIVMENLIYIIGGMVLGAIILYWWSQSHGSKPGKDSSSLLLLQEQLAKLTERIDDRLDKTQLQMRESVAKQFSESAKLITEVTERLVRLDETNKRVGDVASELKTLQNVLQNPKQRGVLGEYYLDSVLKNVLPPDRYQMQYKFKDGSIVDAVIFLDGNKMLPIDSKFTLENYNRLVEEKDSTRKDQLVKQFKQDLKNRIDETAKYILNDGSTMDFAFMFIPSEAIYYDLLINKVGAVQTSARDLIEYAFRDKHVIIVSPTSFMAYLQTVLQGLRSLQIEEQAKEIQVRVGQLGAHMQAYNTYLEKLGSSLGTTVNHYNNAYKEFKKVDKDVVKIAATESKIEAMSLEKPNLED